MHRRRARALVALLLGGSAGYATCHVTAFAGPPAQHVALQSLGLEIALAGVALAAAMLSPVGPRARLGLGPGVLSARWIALLVVGTLAVSHGLDGVLELTGLRAWSSLAHLESTLAGAHGAAFWLALVGIGVAPGIAEELLCRGFVQRGLEARLGAAVAIPLASIFFGALHVDPVHATFAAVLGLYLGLAAHLAGSVRAAIACHVANNLLAVLHTTRWPDLDLVSPVSTAAGFALAAACLWAVERRAPAAAAFPAPAGATHAP